MSRKVLLVEPDLDALASLASRLRSRGLTVALADSADGLTERTRSIKPDVILLSHRVPDAATVAGHLEVESEISRGRCLLLVDGEPTADSSVLQVRASDVEAVVKRVYALSSRPPPTQVTRDDFRGDLRKLGVADLLQLLAMNRRTGTLTLTVPSGAGEVRLVDGDVVDAVFRRLEAEKALYRLLRESQGAFAFTSGPAASVRRITLSSNALLMEGMRLIDEVQRRRQDLALDDDALVATSPPGGIGDEVGRRLLQTLLAPHTLDELLDAVAAPDHVILESLAGLLEAGRVRRLPKGAVRVALADSEQLAILGALANRLRSRGYVGPARIVLAADPNRLTALSHALRRIAQAIPSDEPHETLPLPRRLATIRLGDSAELDLVGLPVVDALSPLWGLALGGSAAAVRIAACGGRMMEEACSVAGVALLDAEALLGDLDETDPTQISALVRATLDAVSGG